MPSKIKDHLFDLDNCDMEFERIIVDKPDDSQFEDEMEDNDEFVALLLNQLRGNMKQPSLDELLDKINNNGVESLTSYEKGILDNYSK
jgi:hypothetical protein